MHGTAISELSLHTFLDRLSGVLTLSFEKWILRMGRPADLFWESGMSCMDPPTDLFPQADLQQRLRFLWPALSPSEQRVFLCRYRYLDTTPEIAVRLGFSQRRVRAMLHRMGNALRANTQETGPA